jgi:N-methylhydantoinase A
VVARFHAEHERLYDYARREAPVEFVNYRLTATGELPKAPIPRINPHGDTGPTPVATREVFFKEAGGFVACPLYDRSHLAAGDRLVGPLIIEQMDSTTAVPPGLMCSVDVFGNLLIAVSGEQR